MKNNYLIMFRPFLVLFIILSCFYVSSLKAEENSDFSDKARDRHYLGGADESDLKVQKSLNTKNKSEENQESNEGF